MKLNILLSILIISFLLQSHVKAAPPPIGLPPLNVSPGAVSEIDRFKQLEDPSNLKKRPKTEVIEEKEEAPKEVDPKTKESKILIKEIIVEDVTLIPQTRIDKIVKPYLNREVSFDDLQQIKKDLTNLYRDKGYVTSRVYLPPQKVKDGVLKFQALEGVIKPISLEEGRFFKARSIFPRLRSDENKVLNIETIKNDLARINENPDVGLQATLKPGPEAGQTELRLQSKDRFPLHLTPFTDNLGRELIGVNRVGFNLNHNNIFGFGDKYTSSYAWSDSSFGLTQGYEIPVGKWGTKLGFNYAHSRLRLGDEFAPLGVVGFATIYSPYISQEILRTKHLQSTFDFAFDFKNLGTNIGSEGKYNIYSGNNGIPFARDRLRILRPGLNIDQFDKYGRTFMRHELGIGINGLWATNSYNQLASRDGSDGNFFRYTGFGTRITQLPFGVQDVFKVIGQYSDDQLNSAEQIQVGGAFTVRGYKEGQMIGDSGLVISNEVRVPFFFLPKNWKFQMTRAGVPKKAFPAADEPFYDYIFRDNLQFVVFTDFGSVYTNQPVAPTPASQYAFGTGVGFRVRLTRFLTARVDFGFPVVRVLPDRQDMVVHFGVQSELF
jgi:hemolysin activation/secretion protein